MTSIHIKKWAHCGCKSSGRHNEIFAFKVEKLEMQTNNSPGTIETKTTNPRPAAYYLAPSAHRATNYATLVFVSLF